MTKIESVSERLNAVLLLELDLLKSGRASEAAALIEEKMNALQAFEEHLQKISLPKISSDERQAIEAVVRMAEENAAHLTAIRNGVRHAVQRLEALNSSVHVGSYRRDGGQISFTNATGAYNRKA
jgi:prophage DNA circulation protein